MLLAFMRLQAEPDAPLLGWLLIAECSCTAASPPTAMFPELRYTFPPLRCHQTNVENVCPAEGRCLWKEMRKELMLQAHYKVKQMTNIFLLPYLKTPA